MHFPSATLLALAVTFTQIAAQSSNVCGTCESQNNLLQYENNGNCWCCPGTVNNDSYCCVHSPSEESNPQASSLIFTDNIVCSAVIPLTASDYANQVEAAASLTVVPSGSSNGGIVVAGSTYYGTTVLGSGVSATEVATTVYGSDGSVTTAETSIQASRTSDGSSSSETSPGSSASAEGASTAGSTGAMAMITAPAQLLAVGAGLAMML